MFDLAGYQETHQLYAGSRTLVYRASRDTTDAALRERQPVIVKVLRNPCPSFRELIRFRNQYAIARNLEHPAVVRPVALERYGNGYALVMPDEGAIALSDYWQQSDRGVAEFLAIAIQLAEALHYLAQQSIVHKDIKPSNILIRPETRQIELIDFSISSLLPKEQQQLTNPNVLEGTLAYISPEQTGRTNRGIDYRTDFYSLGATFFELLTGRLPFEASDPMALVHCHIAQAVRFPEVDDRTAVPQALQAIVRKLMAKNAEDRYQSALGLKYDLEQCLQRLQASGAIAPFELGKRDACDRFLIPEKLYGRETEVQALLDAFQRVANPPESLLAGEGRVDPPESPLAKGGRSANSPEFPSPLDKGPRGVEMVLVAGFSGIGKTAVVNELHKPIARGARYANVKQRGYFIKGKFDQFNRNIPFSAFVQAFRDLMGQLLSESDAELANWKANILHALGDNAQVIVDVVPELEGIIGKQPPVPELSGGAAQNRFNLFFQKFIAAIATPEHPLVVFLDDLQWSDTASLNLMKALMGDAEIGYLLLLGAYRDNEVFPTHPLMLSLAELEKNRAAISTITLEPLALHHINQLVAETLNCSQSLARPLAELVYQKTRGNPFFTTQFLKGLHEDGQIVFIPPQSPLGKGGSEGGYWQCDLVRVRDAALTDDVVEFMARRLRKLPEATRRVLKLAACIGNQFDLETLAVVCEASEEDASADIWAALQEGLVLPASESYKFFQGWEIGDSPVEKLRQRPVDSEPVRYRFLHDRVQQAAYFLIPQDRKQIFHLHIGRLLWQKTPQEQIEEKLFDIVNQLNVGAAAIEEADRREELARLNLRAGCKAKLSTACEAAVSYFKNGLAILPADGWQTHYFLTRDLTIGLTEAEYLSVNLERAEELIAIVLQRTETLLERIPAYKLQIGLELTRYRFDKGLEIGLQVLERLGFPLDKNSAESPQLPELFEIESLPVAEDARYLAAMEIAAYIYAAAVVGAPEIYPPLVTMTVALAGKFGQSPTSAYAYANYGMLQSGRGNLEVGYRAGLLAVGILERFADKVLKCKVYAVFNAFIRIWNEPLEHTLEPLSEAIQSGLETGDYEYAGYCATHRFESLFCMGTPLDSLLATSQQYIELATRIENPHTASALRTWQQVVLNLSDRAENPKHLVGERYDEKMEIEQAKALGLDLVLFFLYIAKILVLYFFGEFAEAVACGEEALACQDSSHVKLYESLFVFYYALALLADCPSTETERQDRLDRATQQQKRLQHWAGRFAPSFQHKSDLIAAEKARVEGDFLQAIDLYDRAIAGAKESKFIHDEALANELAAKFYCGWHKEKAAAGYMQAAYYGYARWGAKAKIGQLETQYPQLLTPILQQQRFEWSALDSLENFNQTLAVAGRSRTESSSRGISEALDFASVLQAAQTLSSTIELERLLGTIVEIVLTNAGAQKAVLLIPQTDRWQLRAIAQITDDGTIETHTRSQCLTSESPVPIRLIQYVKNTQEIVSIDEAKTQISGILEGYLLDRQPQSVLCLPLLNQGDLVGILYLEHAIVKGVFSRDRQTLARFLCAQAAISLQNAQLYDRAQQALCDLQQAQLQIVQSEKMSALGNLVAGVAHEINNPTGFLQGNIQPARDYARDLLNFIDFLLERCPENDPQIQEEIETIDLKFIREDLPNLLDSMDLGVERIRNISHSLRTFSRQDRDRKVAFDIHEGIDSTLLILKHRTKANEKRPVTQIVKDYQAIPEVQCFPGQLNQVFMNILANAMDAFDETNCGRTYAEIEADPNRITIRTSLLERDRVRIQIRDNGCGMKPETRERIFEQGFTTKAVGKGTGLGMAIAHQIVTEKHSGTIHCLSEWGKGSQFTIEIPFESKS